MRNGTQKIGAELLVPDRDCGLLLFLGIAQAFQCQRALAQNRGQHAVGEGLHWLTAQADAEHTIAVPVDTDWPIQGL